MLGPPEPLEDLRGAHAAQLVGQPNAAEGGIVGVERDLATHYPRAIDRGDHPVKDTGTVGRRNGQRADRYLTPTLQRRQECALPAGGEIALGAPFEDFSVPTVSFKFAGK